MLFPSLYPAVITSQQFNHLPALALITLVLSRGLLFPSKEEKVLMSPVLSHLPKKFFAVTSLQQFPIKVWNSELLVRRKRNCKREFKAELLPSEVKQMSSVCANSRLQNKWVFFVCLFLNH